MRYSENLVVGLAQKILVHNGCNPDVQNILGTAKTIVDRSLDTCSDLERRSASSSSLTALDFDIENTYSFEFSTRDDGSNIIGIGDMRYSSGKLSSKNDFSKEFRTTIVNVLLNDQLFKRGRSTKESVKNSVVGFTKLIHGSQIYRADPNHYGCPWFDWVNVKWESGSRVKLYPAKVLMFLDLRQTDFNVNMSHKDCPSGNTILAIVLSAADDTHVATRRKNRSRSRSRKVMGKILKEYYLEESPRVVSCTDIVGPAYVVPNTAHPGDDNYISVIEVNERYTWAGKALEFDVD
jgi:hypothetical protein